MKNVRKWAEEGLIMPLCSKGRQLYICSEFGVKTALYFEVDRFSKEVPAIYAYVYPTFGFDEDGLGYSRRIALSELDNNLLATGKNSPDLIRRRQELQSFLLSHRTVESLEKLIKGSGLFAFDVWTSYHLALCYAWQDKHARAKVLSRKTLSILNVLKEDGTHADPIRSDMELLIEHPEDMKRVMIERATSRTLKNCAVKRPHSPRSA